jgi:hypothetical protein
MSLFVPLWEFNVRREKDATIQWEEGSPPGNCCSNRKQPERLGLVMARVEASGAKGPKKGISEHAGRNMSERRAGLEKANACAEPALNGRRPKWALEASNTRTGLSRRGSGVDMRAKDGCVNTGDPPPCAGESQGNRRPVRARAGRGWKSERPILARRRVTIVERRGLSSRAMPKRPERGE